MLYSYLQDKVWLEKGGGSTVHLLAFSDAHLQLVSLSFIALAGASDCCSPRRQQGHYQQPHKNVPAGCKAAQKPAQGFGLCVIQAEAVLLHVPLCSANKLG